MSQTIQFPENPDFAYLVVLLYVLLGTASRVFYNWMNGQPVGLISSIGQIIISLFASSIALMVTTRLGWKIYGISVACGLSAWLGIKMIDFFETRFMEKMKGRIK